MAQALTVNARQLSQFGVEMSVEESRELTELKDYEKQYRRMTEAWTKELDKPLKVDKHGRVTQGVFWVGVTGGKPVKVKKPKHKCPECGASHTIRQ